MNDNQQPIENRLDRLFARVRQHPPDTSRAELGFETRLMARLRAEREAGGLMFNWAWRLAPVFALIVAALALHTYLTPPVTPAEWNLALTYGIREPILGPVVELDQ